MWLLWWNWSKWKKTPHVGAFVVPAWATHCWVYLWAWCSQCTNVALAEFVATVILILVEKKSSTGCCSDCSSMSCSSLDIACVPFEYGNWLATPLISHMHAHSQKVSFYHPHIGLFVGHLDNDTSIPCEVVLQYSFLKEVTYFPAYSFQSNKITNTAGLVWCWVHPSAIMIAPNGLNCFIIYIQYHTQVHVLTMTYHNQ